MKNRHSVIRLSGPELHNIIKESVRGFLTESQESKSIDQAKKLLMQRLNYSPEEADEFVRIKLRNDFPILRDRKAGKFILGVTRMYLDGQIRDAQTIGNLNTTLKYVASDAHINEYDRNLNDMSVQDLIQRFAKNVEMDMENDRNEVNSMQFAGDSEYNIVPINSFEESEKYGGYTSWCVTHSNRMFDSYTSGGLNQFYFCLRNGFEQVPKEKGEGCPLDDYGLSMIAVSVDENGRLNTCTCRWNHDNGGNDNVMDTKQISNVIGMSFYEVFKPNNKWNEMVANALEKLKNGARPGDAFDKFYGFGENNFAPVSLNGRFNFIDKTGNLLSPKLWFDKCYEFSNNGFAEVKLNEKSNFIDKKGNLLSPNQWFDYCWKFSEGFAQVELNGKKNFINQNGQLLTELPTTDESIKGKWFEHCYSFHEGFTGVVLNGKCNFIDTKGNLLSPNQWFDYCTYFNIGFARVELNGKWVYTDTEGNLYDVETTQPLNMNLKTMKPQNESIRDKMFTNMIVENVMHRIRMQLS